MNSLVTGPLPVKATEQLLSNFRLDKFPSEDRVSFFSRAATPCLPLLTVDPKGLKILLVFYQSCIIKTKEKEYIKVNQCPPLLHIRLDSRDNICQELQIQMGLEILFWKYEILK
jgi:hypothetical protein